LVGGSFGKKIRRDVGRKKVLLTCGAMVLATHREGKHGARVLGLRRLGPERVGETGRVDLGSRKPSGPTGGGERSGGS
jgi:hypothetical protein